MEGPDVEAAGFRKLNGGFEVSEVVVVVEDVFAPELAGVDEFEPEKKPPVVAGFAAPPNGFEVVPAVPVVPEKGPADVAGV